MKKRQKEGVALTYRAILILAVTAIFALDLILAVLIYSKFFPPHYEANLRQQMRQAYDTLAADPACDKLALERANYRILLVRSDGSVYYSSRAADEQTVRQMIRDVTRHNANPFFTITGTDTEGSLYLSGSTDQFYIQIGVQLDPIYAMLRTFTRYTLGMGLLLWLVTFLLVLTVERRLFTPILEAGQVAERIAQFDFSKSCETGAMAKESRELAQSINKMSARMQATLRQLKQANDRLKEDILAVERSEAAMKSLISNLSHDLKTPVALISGYAEGLSAGMAKTPEQMHEYCAIIMDETERMQTIIRRMLRLSQLESGQVAPQCERVDLSVLLGRILDNFNLEIERRRIGCRREFERQLEVWSDPAALDQVLTNLIQNAVYHSAAPYQMCVRASRREQSVRVEVYNTCRRMTPEQFSHIWDRFYRGSVSRSRDHGEVGLGLAIVRGNLELLHHPYGAEQTDDGIVFYLELPVYAGQDT